MKMFGDICGGTKTSQSMNKTGKDEMMKLYSRNAKIKLGNVGTRKN